MDLLSINMSINNGDVERRYHDLSEYVVRRGVDLLMVQEVSIDVGQVALRGLASRLGPDFTMHYEPVYPGQEDEQGLAIVTSLPVVKSNTTELLLGGNQAQTVEMEGNKRKLLAANVHLEASPLKEFYRKAKMLELVDELDEFENHGQILAGDLNSLPFFPTIRALKKQGFASAYKAVHGHEPRATFPTMSPDTLIKDGYLTPEEIAQLKKVSSWLYPFSSEKHDIPEYTTDYVFTKGLSLPAAAKLVTAKARYNPAISDHKGIAVAQPIE